jgi:hypothetical protein
MNNARRELIDKCNTLSFDDLCTYRATIKRANNVISIIGISTLFTMILITNIVTILVGFIIVFIMGHFSVGISEVNSIIQDHIESRFPDK